MTGGLRLAAVAIAVAGAIDPALSSRRNVKPEVALLESTRLPSPMLTERVAAALESRFRVVRGPSFGAAATVFVGDDLPADVRRPTPVAFAVQPVATTPFISIVFVGTAERGQLHSRIPVRVTVRALAATGRDFTVIARSQGVAIDSASRKIGSADATEVVELGFVASTTGRTRVSLSAEISGDGNSHVVDATVNIVNDRYAVLAFDRRPSWMATFVRRALESDPRFIVTSRVSTSRGAATTAGDPPASLAGLPSLEHFDAVVIGAPDELTMADATGLEAFMRRGGLVVLLLDEPAAGAALERLTGVTEWRSSSLETPTGTPRASELFRPAAMPRWASPVEPAEPALVSVWSTPVGSGQLIVSGALDSWRFRDAANAPDIDQWDQYRRLLAAEAADRSRRSLAGPEAQEAGRAPIPDERALVRVWAAAHGGRVISETQLEELAPALTQTLAPSTLTVRTHPMRSAWWIVPFGILLGTEWWMRRRAGRT